MTAINTFATQTNTTNIKNPFVIPGIRKLVIDPQLNPNYTFDTFVEGDCNRLCRSAGFSVAVDPGATPFNPLYIYGDSGLGKTISRRRSAWKLNNAVRRCRYFMCR